MFQSRFIAAAIAGLVCAGCSSSRIRPVQSFVDAPAGGEVLVSDASSWRLVALAGHRATRDDAGRLAVTVDLKNLSALDLPVEILTVFHGADGVAFEDELGWSNVVIPGNSQHHHKALSKNHFAASFRVFIRTP